MYKEQNTIQSNGIRASANTPSICPAGGKESAIIGQVTLRVSSFPRINVGVPRRFQKHGPGLRARTSDTTGGMIKLRPASRTSGQEPTEGDCANMRKWREKYPELM